ncbi:MAG: hypothetical protein NTY96_00225 [Bacteroidetes bacterium]|nr:hypothetical protein [Bacteroidota bacterium]
MKTKSIFFSLLLLGFLAAGLQSTASEMKERKEIYSFERIIKPETLINFENKVGPLKVETWGKNSVKVDVSVAIDGEEDQVQKALEVIRKMNFSQDGDKVSFNTRFYKTMSGMMPGNFRIIFLDGSTARLYKLDLSFVLTMPKDNPLALTQSYENVTLPDLNGRITLDLYESDLIAGKLPNCQSLIAKYGKAEIDSVRDINLNIYENKLKLTHAGNVTMNSKYSETEISSAGTMSINSYEDKLSIIKHGDLSIKAKYTTFTLADFYKGAFDLFECKLKAGNCDIIAISAKYCELEFISCKAIVLTSFENKFISDQVGDLKAGSSYSSYKISQLDGSLYFTSSQEDKISVMQVGKKFTGINLISKYSDVDLLFEPGVAYKLDADLKYTSMDYPKSSFREIRYHKEDDVFRYLGVTQGGDENTVSTVKLEMYEGGIKLK